MRHTAGGPALLRALLIITVTLLTILDTKLATAATSERRGSTLQSARHELRPAAKINEQVIPDTYSSGSASREVGDRSRDAADRTRRSTLNDISLNGALPEILQEEVHETLDDHPDENLEIKRRWTSGRNMAVWGKRDGPDDDVTEEEKRKWGGERKMAVWGKRDDHTIEDVKRKWRNGQKMAVWGKRSALDDYANARKRKWRSGNRMDLWGKRKWASRNMAVWGKRDWSGPKLSSETDNDFDVKRSWRGRDMAVWG